MNPTSKIFSYPTIIKEVYLDVFGHMNNAMYLTLLEEARWDFISKNGYDLQKIISTGLGPTILEINIKYLKELKVRDEINIETQLISYVGKIGKIGHRILRANQLCCTAEMIFGLFSVHERKLVLPTPDWLYAVGAEIDTK